MADNINRKLNNPLLTAVNRGYPYEDFQIQTLLMPAAPPPAQSDPGPSPVVQCDNLSQPVVNDPRIIGVDTPANYSQVNHTSLSTDIPLFSTSASTISPLVGLTTVQSENSPPQSSHRLGYFKSILSSLPSLPLSTTAATNTTPTSDASIKAPSFGIETSQPNQSYSNNTTEPSANSTKVVQYPPVTSLPNFNAQSYRLGNQRRLKYAPPPNLTLTSQQTNIQQSPIGHFNQPTGTIAATTQETLINPPNIFIPNYGNNLENSPAESDKNINKEELLIPTKLLVPLSSDLSIENNNSKKINQQSCENLPIISTIKVPEASTETPSIISHPIPAQQFTPANYFPTPLSSNNINNQNNPFNNTNIINDKFDNISVSDVLNPIEFKSDEIINQPLEGGDKELVEGLSEIDLSKEQPITPVTTATTSASNFENLQQQSQYPTSFDALIYSQNLIPVFPATSSPFFYNPTAVNLNPNLQVSSSSSFEDNLTTNAQRDERLVDENLKVPEKSIKVSEDLSSQSNNPPSWDSFMSTLMPEATGSATLNPTQTSVNPSVGRVLTETVPPSFQSLASSQKNKKMPYRPVYYHWFYCREVENKTLWLPFSMQDSLNLEEVCNSIEITPDTKVPTDGGRYDVEILKRQRIPVYWSGKSKEVRRSSWFYKGSSESKYIPYDESTAARLEEEYKQACLTDDWNRRIELDNGEYIIFHSSTIQVHYLPVTSPELIASWGNTSSGSSRPKVVKRGVDEFHIEEGEPEKIDHLLFLVHGIGSVCDLKFRTVEEVVDEFRSIALKLVQSHYHSATIHGIVNRIEVLPISWHAILHSDDMNKKLCAITLNSIPKLRYFTNDTLLDILFYTSPIYCQTIMQTVGNEMNRLYALFKERNSGFSGSVYLGGHSLGSLIVFDLLCHQKPPPPPPPSSPTPSKSTETRGDNDDGHLDDSEHSDEDTIGSTIKPMPQSILKRRLSRKVSYVMGAAGTGQPFIVYPHLNFYPRAFFALGSPIGMFVTVRGIDNLGEKFKLPTCPAFFNIFHPFDPVAYRVESLINPQSSKYPPMLIPHHKGRKRMHLELKETMVRVGADLKQKVLDSMKSTWNSFYQFTIFNKALEEQIGKAVEEQLTSTITEKSLKSDDIIPENRDDNEPDINIGLLNQGRRVDYVLQEAPFEYINEYIFALTSHVCYWESEDTMLLMLKEMYGSNGIQADAQIPH